MLPPGHDPPGSAPLADPSQTISNRTGSHMAKVICVLYDHPIDGYPTRYARDDCPRPEHYPDGQTLPTPKGIDFKPGSLLGSVSGELGLRSFLESNGHELIVTSSKDGPGNLLDRELADADIVISQPFRPAYMTAERIAKARTLKPKRCHEQDPAPDDLSLDRTSHRHQPGNRGGVRIEISGKFPPYTLY